MGYAGVKIGEIPEEGRNSYLFKYFAIYTKRNKKAINIPKHESTKVSRNINIPQMQKHNG